MDDLALISGSFRRTMPRLTRPNTLEKSISRIAAILPELSVVLTRISLREMEQWTTKQVGRFLKCVGPRVGVICMVQRETGYPNKGGRTSSSVWTSVSTRFILMRK